MTVNAAYPLRERLVPSVVDADALLSSIHNQCKKGWESRLAQLGKAQRSPVFASAHVLDEVYRGFPKLVSSGEVTVEEMRSCFELAYLPYINWVHVAQVLVLDERVMAVAQVDATDVPTALLATLIAPTIVYSDDHSLKHPGFAPEAWREAAGTAVTAVEQQSTEEGVSILIGLPAIGLYRGSVGVCCWIGLPSWAGPLALAGGIAWALTARERREATARFLEPLTAAAVQFSERQAATREELAAVVFDPGQRPDLKQRVARVLARAAEPLLAREIADRVRDEKVVLVREVRSLLTGAPEFIRVGYRWQLGQCHIAPGV